MTALLLLGLPALAFQPPVDVAVGLEPTRVRRTFPATQHALRHGEAWQVFLDGEGEGWLARFDERTGTPHRAWGRGISLAQSADRDAVVAGLQGFVARNAALLGGVDPSDLVVERAGYVARTDTWYLRLGQRARTVRGDVPVWRGGVEARVRQGRLIMFGMDVYPDAAVLDTPIKVEAETAVEIAIQDGPAPFALHTEPRAELVALPLEVDGELRTHVAWEVRTRTTEPPGIWVSFVDADTGALLNVHNEVRFLSGTLTATHDTRTLDGDTTTSAMPWARVEGAGGDITVTDEDGAWELDDEDAATTSLYGTYVYVRNYSGSADGELDLDGDGTWTDDDATQAEIDSFIFINQVMEWARAYVPEVSYTSTRIRSNVNISSSCNAYYDGSVNFLRAGSPCNNTGQIADVAYHEWGHGLHYYSLESGSYDSSVGEGFSDTVAFMLTGDATIAPYFYTSGGGIREVATDKVYPDDIEGESHADGLIYAGAVWDLWAALEDAYPGDPDAAYDALVTLSLDAIKGGPEIETAYDEFVAADDDNGDLSDGTPHMCSIIEAFNLHGLGPGGTSALVQVSHLPLGNQAADDADYALDADIVNLAPTCVDASAEEATVIYSTDGGSTWATAALTVGTDAVAGSIPAQPAGTILTYYLSVESSDGDTLFAPTGGVINPYTFFVGELDEVGCQDFEDDEGGYTSELISGSDDLGANDWTWGRPTGAGGDPDAAASGRYVWGNDLGGGRYNGEYQDDKRNRLTSPEIDIPSGVERLVLQYQRWLNVEDGYYDQARILANDEIVWSNHATTRAIGDEHHQDDQWMLHTVELPVPTSGALTLAFDLETDGGLTMGGWTVDDVCVYAIYGEDAEVDDDELPPGDDTGADAVDDTGGAGDEGGGDVEDTGTPDLVGKGGCGCAAGGTGRAGGLFGLLLVGLVAVRRRALG